MVTITPLTLSKVTSAAVEKMEDGTLLMHPKDAMNYVQNVLEAVAAAFESGAFTIKE